MSSQRLLIRNGFVVSMDPEVGDVLGGEVLVEDGKIAEVGTKLVVRKLEESRNHILSGGGRLLDWCSDPV